MERERLFPVFLRDVRVHAILSLQCERTGAFPKRIGEKGMELILSESIRVSQKEDDRDHHETAFIDSTVQEKNETCPRTRSCIKRLSAKCCPP